MLHLPCPNHQRCGGTVEIIVKRTPLPEGEREEDGYYYDARLEPCSSTCDCTLDDVQEEDLIDAAERQAHAWFKARWVTLNTLGEVEAEPA